jgi:hypothetical protein
MVAFIKSVIKATDLRRRFTGGVGTGGLAGQASGTTVDGRNALI